MLGAVFGLSLVHFFLLIYIFRESSYIHNRRYIASLPQTFPPSPPKQKNASFRKIIFSIIFPRPATFSRRLALWEGGSFCPCARYCFNPTGSSLFCFLCAGKGRARRARGKGGWWLLAFFLSWCGDVERGGAVGCCFAVCNLFHYHHYCYYHRVHLPALIDLPEAILRGCVQNYLGVESMPTRLTALYVVVFFGLGKSLVCGRAVYGLMCGGHSMRRIRTWIEVVAVCCFVAAICRPWTRRFLFE